MMDKQLVLLTLLYMIFWKNGLCVCEIITCPPGAILRTEDNVDFCIVCKSGTFMADIDHRNTECHKCSSIENEELEIRITDCNGTHNTVIHCVHEFFRQKAGTTLEKDRCVECQKCDSGFPARLCHGYNDTLCCPLHHDAVLACDGKYECKERPAPCGAGMYYNTTFDKCIACPSSTYMHAQNHTNKECVKCETLSGDSSNHAAILQPCNSTSPTIFGCEDGYFRDINQVSLLIEAPCAFCKKCGQEVTKCQMFHDAECTAESSVTDNPSEGGPGDGQNVDNGAHGKTTSFSKDVPESGGVKYASKASSYEISILFVGEMLLHGFFTLMRCFKRAYTPGKSFNPRAILHEVYILCRDYYFSLFVMSVVLRILFVIYYAGFVGGFTKYDILNTLWIVSVVTSLLYLGYLVLSKYIVVCWKKLWDYVCLWKQQLQLLVTTRLSGRKTRADNVNRAQTVKFINNSPNTPGTQQGEFDALQ